MSSAFIKITNFYCLYILSIIRHYIILIRNICIRNEKFSHRDEYETLFRCIIFHLRVVFSTTMRYNIIGDEYEAD